jgi:hypothetical protein
MRIQNIRRIGLACALAGFALIANAQDHAPPEVQEFLVASSAADFAAHPQTRPGKVRNVHLRYTQGNDGKRMYLLCGQFQPASATDETVWDDFATIQTEGYEQWLGAQASGLCNESSALSQNGEDLSAVLQARLENASVAK